MKFFTQTKTEKADSNVLTALTKEELRQVKGGDDVGGIELVPPPPPR